MFEALWKDKGVMIVAVSTASGCDKHLLLVLRSSAAVQRMKPLSAPFRGLID